MGKFKTTIPTTKNNNEILSIIRQFSAKKDFKPIGNPSKNLWRKGHLWAQSIQFQINEGFIQVEAWMNVPIPGMGSYLFYFISKDTLKATVQELGELLNDGNSTLPSAAMTALKNEVEYADFGQRFGAMAVDIFILYIGGALVAGFFGSLFNGILRLAGFNFGMTFSSIIGFVFLIVFWLYFTLSESSTKQATLGKMVFHIRVTDTSGNRLTFGRANGRYWSKFISAFPVLFGFFIAAFTRKKQGLHDLIASTVVVRHSMEMPL